SILLISVWMLSPTLSWLPVAPELTKESVVPLTVMVSPATKPGEIESEGLAPDNAVAPVTGAGVAAWLLTGVPIAELAVLKKLSPATIADAATSEVLASFVIAVFSAVLRLVWVLAGLTGTLASIAKLPTGVGVAVDAVRSICSVEPSGSVNFTLNLSPLFGLVPLRFTEKDTGEPLGPVTVAPVSV